MANILTAETVKEYGSNAGACVVGIAVSKDFGAAPDGYKPSDLLEGCVSVIVLGAPSPREALNNSEDYTASRNEMLGKMTDISKEVAKRIKKDGYNTKAISASGGKFVNGVTYGHMSLKHAAELAGLGFIGKNYLLINPRYGNMLWLSAVLTDAELAPDKKIGSNACGSCGICVESCPSRALDDINNFGKKDCAKFFSMANKKFEIRCYKCREVCPLCFGYAAPDVK